MEQASNDAASSADDNMDELLDSCLEDFDKPLPKSTAAEPQPKQTSSESQKSKTSNTDAKMPESMAWSEEFKQFSEVMENFLEDQSELNGLKDLMGSLSQSGALGSDENFAESFAETIRELTEGAQNIPEPTQEELANIFNGLGLNDPNQSEEQLSELMPLMHNVMQKLMSKELLYPSLKEIVEKYPEWLAEKQTSLKEEEYELYSRQYDLMKEVCHEFEQDSNDSQEVQNKRFEKVLQLMQKIQNCGNPPKELVSDIGQGVPLDELGNLQIPGMPQQCAIM